MNAAHLMAGGLVLLVSCGRQNPERVYRVPAAWRNGNSTMLGPRPLVREQLSTVSECRSKGRLLEAEILLYDIQLTSAASILAENVPDSVRRCEPGEHAGGGHACCQRQPRYGRSLPANGATTGVIVRRLDALLDAETWNGRLLYLLKRRGPRKMSFATQLLKLPPGMTPTTKPLH